MNLYIIAFIMIIGYTIMYVTRNSKFFRYYFIRFVAAGVANTVNYTALFIIFNIILNYKLAHVFAFLISALISYFITTIYTFSKSVDWYTFLRFPLTFLPNLIFSTFMTVIVVENNILPENIASIVVMICAIPITFVIGKMIYLGRGE